MVRQTKRISIWKYRIKIVEKVYYLILIGLSFVFYKCPGLFATVFVVNGHLSIPCVPASIILFHLVHWLLDQKLQSLEDDLKELKQAQKDIKSQLLSKMDPLLVEAFKEIVRSDMKKELKEMRNSDRGCS